MTILVKSLNWQRVKHANKHTSQVAAWLWVRHVVDDHTGQVTELAAGEACQ